MAEAHDFLHVKKPYPDILRCSAESMRPTLLVVLSFALLAASVRAADMNCALDDQNLLSRVTTSAQVMACYLSRI